MLSKIFVGSVMTVLLGIPGIGLVSALVVMWPH